MVEQICNVLNAQMLTINCAVISTCFVSCLRFLLDFVLFVMFFFLGLIFSASLLVRLGN